MSRLLACFLSLLAFAPISHADDWPQWLGPQRDGVWREKGLLASFPKDGLKIVWKAPVAGGYSSPTVADGRVFVTDFAPLPDTQRPGNPFQRMAQAGQERLHCFEQSTGKELWVTSYPVSYTMSYSAGPRAAPAVDGDRVYTLGGEGDLRCNQVATGQLVWSFKSSGEAHPTPTWGFASNPLIDGDHLLRLTGGTDPEHGQGVVTAFDKLTGKVAWSAFSYKEPGYSAPIICQAGGVRQLIVWEPQALHGLDPATGKVYWSIPFGPAKMGLTIITPRFYHDEKLGSFLFVATQYEGSMVVQLDDHEPKARLLWKRAGKSDRKTDALHTLLSPVAIRDAHIYGIDAYGDLRCLDLLTGDRLWSTTAATTYDAGPQKWSSAFIIALGDTGSRYLIANEHGDLILADLSAAGYHEISRTHLLDPTNTDPRRPVLWCCPAFAGRCIFWRNDKEIVCASMAE
jgi:outer membrane protein assembly factor BamB